MILQGIKPEGFAVDAGGMQSMGDSLTLVMLVIGGAGLLGVLHILGMLVHNETYVHDLRVKVNSLRNEKLRRLVEMGEADVIEVGEADVIEAPAQDATEAPAKAA